MADYISRGGSQQKPAQPLNHNFLLHRRASSSASPASWLLRVISAKYLQRRATCRWTSEHAAPPQSSADRPFHWIPCSLCFSCGQQSLYHPPARTQPPGDMARFEIKAQSSGGVAASTSSSPNRKGLTFGGDPHFPCILAMWRWSLGRLLSLLHCKCF